MAATRTLDLGFWVALTCVCVISCGGAERADSVSTTTPEFPAPSSEPSAGASSSNDSASTADSSGTVTHDGDASSSTGEDDWVRILTERAGGMARGPANIPLAEATSLASACEQAGQTFIDGQGVCVAHTLSEDVQLFGPTDEELAACPDGPPFNSTSPPTAPEVEFASMNVGGVTLGANDSGVLYDVAVVVHQTQCFGRLYFQLAWSDALPHFRVGEAFTFRKDFRLRGGSDYEEPVPTGYTEIRAANDDLLWLSFTGEFASHGDLRAPDAALEVIQDDDPACYWYIGDSALLQYGATFRTPNGECHLEPASANCCTLWGEPYLVQLDMFYKEDMLNYLIVKADFLASVEEIRSLGEE